jgi:glycosyltransferase involved in cell wall biosynthesis
MAYTMILDGNYPQDIRVRKEAESIAESGIPIQILTRWRAGEKRLETINGVKVFRLGKDYTHTRKGINDIVTALFYVDFPFRKALSNFLNQENVSVIHVHDLPLIKTVVNCNKKRFPVILDLHENYPEMLEELKFSTKGVFKSIKDSLFFSVSKWKKFEKKCIHRPDHIIAVIEEMKEKLIKEYAIPSHKLTVISNYEKLDFSQNSEVDDFEFKKEVFYIAYVGGISPVRGLETVIEAVAIFKRNFENIELLIVGNGNSSYLNGLIQLATNLDCLDKVHFLGHKQFKKINYYIENVNVNVIPHVKNEHTDNTIPHKLFQIMMQKAPLLVSDCNPMKRILLENKAGFIFKASNPEDFVKVIKEIQSNKSEVDLRVENAFNTVNEKLNWENEAVKLVKLIKEYNG